MKRKNSKDFYNDENKLKWFTSKYNFPLHYFKEKIYIEKALKKDTSFFESLNGKELSSLLSEATKEIRKCKTRKEIVIIKNKYKGLEDISLMYKKVIVDRYEILI